MDFLQWLESTSLSTWVRESPSIFAFPTILLLHTIGMGLCVGISAGINFRILGFAPSLRLSPMTKLFPVLWFGFWLNAITGTILVVQDASNKLRNLDFYTKMVFIVLALLVLAKIKNQVLTDPKVDSGPLNSSARTLAYLSLLFWLGAITCGRLLAYVGPWGGVG